MLLLKITSNGKKYSNIEDGVNAIFVNGVTDIVRKKIAHLESSLEAERAEIEVNIKSGKVRIKNVSDELGEKIKAALANDTF